MRGSHNLLHSPAWRMRRDIYQLLRPFLGRQMVKNGPACAVSVWFASCSPDLMRGAALLAAVSCVLPDTQHYTPTFLSVREIQNLKLEERPAYIFQPANVLAHRFNEEKSCHDADSRLTARCRTRVCADDPVGSSSTSKSWEKITSGKCVAGSANVPARHRKREPCYLFLSTSCAGR